MTYTALRDLVFVEGGGPGTIVCPAGTTLESIPAGLLSFADAAHLARMTALEAKRAPNRRMVPVLWRDEMRVLAVGEAITPHVGSAKRRIVVGGT